MAKSTYVGTERRQRPQAAGPSWQFVVLTLGTGIIASIPGILAAIVSLHNGAKIDENHADSVGRIRRVETQVNRTAKALAVDMPVPTEVKEPQ